MALGAAAALGVGMMAGGAVMTDKAARMKANPNKDSYVYGGSNDALAIQRDRYNKQLQQGAVNYDADRGAVGDVGSEAYRTSRNLADSAGMLGRRYASAPVAMVGTEALNGYDPAAVARVQAQVAMQQNARANLAAARGIGGAAAMRTALQNNAMSGVYAAPAIAAAAADARNQQALQLQQVAAQNVAQQNQARQFALQGQTQALGMQGQFINQGLEGALGAANTQLGATANREALYNSAQQNLEQQQLQAQMAYDAALRGEKQQVRQIYGGLGGSLIGGGASMFQSGIGGFSGGGK